MPTPATRWIGLSLGADLCWPLCFEHLLRRLDLAIPWQGEEVRVDVERVTIEPFDLQQRTKYTVVLDRLTHWYHTSREWIKKSVILDDVYVLNNPWAVQSMEKHTTYAAMMRLGMPIPKTWMVPPKEYEQSNPDLEPTLRRYAKLFDLGKVGEQVGYPLFMKPYDGGAWRGVSKIDDEAKLREAYEESGKNVMHLQAAVVPFDLFVRAIGMGPQVNVVKYDPAAPLHDRYRMEAPPIDADERSLARGHLPHHQHLLRLGLQLLREPAEGRQLPPHRLRQRLPRQPGDVAALPLPLAGARQAALGGLLRGDAPPHAADARLGALLRGGAAGAAVSREALPLRRYRPRSGSRPTASPSSAPSTSAHLDAVADEFFASPECREAVRLKVEALYPAHEVEPFTDLFFGRIQRWREEQGAARQILERARQSLADDEHHRHRLPAERRAGPRIDHLAGLDAARRLDQRQAGHRDLAPAKAAASSGSRKRRYLVDCEARWKWLGV